MPLLTKINLKLSNSAIVYVHLHLGLSSKRFPWIYLLVAIFLGILSPTVVYRWALTYSWTSALKNYLLFLIQLSFLFEHFHLDDLLIM